jgi:hypothetical protein
MLLFEGVIVGRLCVRSRKEFKQAETYFGDPTDIG